MSCAFCGMPPRDGEGCCTGTFRADTMRRADKRINALESTLLATRAELERTRALTDAAMAVDVALIAWKRRTDGPSQRDLDMAIERFRTEFRAMRAQAKGDK